MTARRVAWFHCFSGIAGDMALGSLIDAGADVDEVRQILNGLPLSGWGLEAEAVMRNGIGGTKAHVLEEPTNVIRTAGHIEAMLSEAVLPPRVRDRSLAVFKALAEAEGHLHRQAPEQVHFHEVGAIDAIVDIVGSCAALEVLDIDEVACSPVSNGLGTIRAAHGILPNPPPAVVELLRGIPTIGLEVPYELTTPTGAALVAALSVQFGPMPDMTIEVAGFGAGTREIEGRPNLLQVVIGERTPVLSRGQGIQLFEVNVDDVTGEVLAHAVAALLEAGAHDAWITPIVMKKGRPAYTVSALGDPTLSDQIVTVMRQETGSFGIRATAMERWPGARHGDVVDIDGEPIRVKVGPGRIKAEFDDASLAARRLGRPVREILARAEAAYRSGYITEHEHGHSHPHSHDHEHGHSHPDHHGPLGPSNPDDDEPA